MIFFTSDPHFWHARVIEYCARPYATVEEMNEDMIKKWNETVKPEDTVYCLGDFSMAFRSVEIYSFRLNGVRKLVPGNHDMAHSYHKRSKKKENQEKWIQKYKDYMWDVLPEQFVLDIPGVGTFNLCHHPYAGPYELEGGHDKYKDWRPTDDGRILICGHVHDSWKTKRSPNGTLMINVGVDVWDFKPVSLDEIVALIAAESQNG
jgi:calcineurin-like phosphoesterase family protein